MRILGIDPGSRFTGFGIIEINNFKQVSYLISGCINLVKYTWTERLKLIYLNISDIIKQYNPDKIAIEEIFVSHNPRGALKLGQARGAAIAAGAMADLTINEYAARVVKKTIVGYGAADKRQMQLMVQKILNLDQLPSADSADAMAIALCDYYSTLKYK